MDNSFILSNISLIQVLTLPSLMTYYSESASEIFSKSGEARSYFPLEKNLFPNLSSKDIIEISGESGSGKTELLYHFIVCCIFPLSWKGIKIGGLETQVTFIDNDCHFDLLRLVTILEHRIKLYIKFSKGTVGKEEIFSFIQDILKFLCIVKCYDADEYLLTVNSLESTLCMQSKRSIIMIDGISSFYWSDKARFQNNFSKLTSHYRVVTELIIKISKNCGTPIIVTRRKLLSTTDSDKKVFGQLWKSAVAWKFELEFKASLPDKTLMTVFDSLNKITKQCTITKQGFSILEEKIK